MKQRRPLPWKRLLLGFLAVFLLVRLYMEYFWIAVFFSVFLVLMLGRFLWDFVQMNRRKKQAERQRTDGEEREQALRRAACANARYGGTERQMVETYIRETFGPMARVVPLPEQADLPMPMEAALIPPDRVSSCWRAVTIGAGACAAGETRMELAMLLQPDWEEGEDWPLRVLREAVRSFLITQGRAHPGMTLRSFQLTSRGFAGAVLTEDLASQYPLEPLTLLPTGETLRFYWLVPLLKPEWDYLERRERGYAALTRRLSSIDPAVPVRRLCGEGAPPRPSCVDSLTWFQEDIAPFAWSESGDRWCLGLDAGEFCRELFLRAGLNGTGWDWERLARAYLRRYQPDDGPFVEYACEEQVFFAASEDEEILRRMALGLSDLLRYEPDRALMLLVPEGRVRKGEI